MIKTCDFCNGPVVKTSNAEIYGKEFGNGMCYLCRNCKASVGTHNNGKPLGILANREMRALKKCCHELFDYVWRFGGLTRSGAYTILSEKLGIDRKDCHFGHFGIDMLHKSIKVLSDKNWYKNIEKENKNGRR